VLEHIRKIAIDQIAQDLKTFLAFIRKKLKAFDRYAVAKESHWQRLSFSKFMYSILIINLSAFALGM